jgi:hypothetical protein
LRIPLCNVNKFVLPPLADFFADVAGKTSLSRQQKCIVTSAKKSTERVKQISQHYRGNHQKKIARDKAKHAYIA